MQGDAGDFVAALPMPALLIRRDERIAAANDGARAILSEGIVGRHFITALRNPDMLDAIEACLRDKPQQDTLFRTSDQRQDLAFRVFVRGIVLDSGRAALVCFQDISQEEQIGQIRRDFVANVSHELRTPLTALIGFIETLRGPAQDDPNARDRFLSIMEREASRMNRLIGDLLSLSRVEADERVRPTQRLNLSELIGSVVNALAPFASENETRVTVLTPDVAVHVLGDPDQLRQVLNNLIENGIKYSGKNADVTVRLGEPSYEAGLRALGVRLSVEDTGPGIDPYHIPRLTERFYRVDSHRSREMGGTGLGLAIVKHIVHRHRGRLKIESTPGEGSRFHVTLPLA